MKHIATIDTNVIRLAHAAAVERTRPILETVYLANGQAIAADGFMAVECPAKTWDAEPVLIPAKAILSLKSKVVKVYRLGKHSGLLLIGNKGESAITKPIKGLFPDLDKLYPDTEPKATIALSSNMLFQLAKVVPKDSVIRLAIRERSEAIEFIAGQARGLLMPIYTDWSKTKWHYQEKK